MNNTKIIIIYIAGMLTLATILIGADMYNRKMNSFCFEPERNIEDFKPVK